MMLSSAKATPPLTGQLFLPGDKSISHRAIMLAALAEGNTDIHGFLEAEDCLATLRAFQAMGICIEYKTDGPSSYLQVKGLGKKGLKKPLQDIDCGNSGTSMRLLVGILAGQPFNSRLWGDDSLSRRPMRRVIDPLSLMGAKIKSHDGRAPLCIQGSSQALKAIRYTVPVPSAQVKSALLLAALYGDGLTEIIEPIPTRDHTENMLRAFSYPLKCEAEKISISSHGKLIGTTIQVPGDISAAAFFIVAATLVPGSSLVIKSVGLNPRRLGLIDALKQMGAQITMEVTANIGGEPIGDLLIQYSDLKGIHLSPVLIPAMIDEIPIFCIAAAFAEGTTRIEGAKELRYKESDRLEAMAMGLSSLGIAVEILEDGLVIEGNGYHPLAGGQVDSFKDHRIAMAFAIAGGLSERPIIIQNADCLSVSFPDFVKLANHLNLSMILR